MQERRPNITHAMERIPYDSWTPFLGEGVTKSAFHKSAGQERKPGSPTAWPQESISRINPGYNNIINLILVNQTWLRGRKSGVQYIKGHKMGLLLSESGIHQAAGRLLKIRKRHDQNADALELLGSGRSANAFSTTCIRTWSFPTPLSAHARGLSLPMSSEAPHFSSCLPSCYFLFSAYSLP